MPDAPSIPAGSVLGRSFEYGVDVNLGTPDVPTWQAVRRHSAFQPTPTPVTADAGSYDDFGSQNLEVVGWNNTVAFTVLVNRSPTTGLYLPEVEAILARSRPESKGDLAVIEARWYHKPESGTPNPNDAQQGLATVAAQRTNTGNDGATETLQVTLTNKGPWQTIANPFAGWGVTAPVVSGVTPAGALDGDLVSISGAGFVGATELTIGGLPAEFQVVGGSTIVAIMPIGDAGPVDVVVTNAAGASAPFSYTRGA